MTYLRKTILQGTNDSGEVVDVPTTQEGHLEVALHAPRLPFGSVHTERLRPEFQTDGVYGVNAGQLLSTTGGSGATSSASSSLSCSTGTTIYSQAILQSRKRLRYRPGQGLVGRFAGYFTTPVDNSYQLIGYGHAEDGVYFGYGNTADLTDNRFGILYVKRGVREVKTLTVTTGATASGNVTITLNGTAYTIAVTNSSNIQRTVWEISQGTYAGWEAFPLGATVVFVRNSAGTTAGTQSFSAGATGAAATIAQTTSGAASTDTFYPQDEWNGDKLDGTGASGVIANWQNGNVFQINIQYLGYGAIVFMVEVCGTNQNNPDFVVVHTIKNPNTLTDTTFGNPSFPFTMAAYSAGSTTDLTVKVGSFAGFLEGEKLLHGNRFTYVNSLTTVGATNYQALFTIKNMLVFNGRTNQSVISLRSVTGALKHTQPCIFYLIKNGALVGNPNFSQYSTSSCSAWDTTTTNVTFTDNAQILWSGHLGETGDIDHHFTNGSTEDLTLQPGEWVTLAARAVTGTPSYVTGSLNTREDQ